MAYSLTALSSAARFSASTPSGYNLLAASRNCCRRTSFINTTGSEFAVCVASFSAANCSGVASGLSAAIETSSATNAATGAPAAETRGETMCPSSRRTQPSIAHSSGGCGGATGPLAACEPNPNADNTVLNNPPMPVVTAVAGELMRVDVCADCGTIAANVETANEAAESVSVAMRIPWLVIVVVGVRRCDDGLRSGSRLRLRRVDVVGHGVVVRPLRVSDVSSVSSSVSSESSGTVDSDESSSSARLGLVLIGVVFVGFLAGRVLAVIVGVRVIARRVGVVRRPRGRRIG